ncbi:MAG: hypothetical protein HYY24_14250 [Verrucomicrobia bacterium]|nr:hypothetical protein [Verrucomicrobiota bacterium]
MPSTTYESYPASTVVLSNALALAIYVIGAVILSDLGAWAVVLYVAYCVWIEFRILTKSCVSCYYYGKWCGLGKGKLCALLFKRGDPAKFAQSVVSWRDLLPDFLVSLVPLVVGVVLLARNFSWTLVALVIALAALTFGGNAVVRSCLLCKYCKQRELGCPAQKLFAGANRQPRNQPT